MLTCRSIMPLLFPTQGTLHDIFAQSSPISKRTSDLSTPKSSYQARTDLYPAWSAVDDMKSKAGSMSNEAQKEIQKASQAARAEAGQIELYSVKYYAACTLGGMLACVGIGNDDGEMTTYHLCRGLPIQLSLL